VFWMVFLELAQEFITLPPNECPYEVQRNPKFYPFFKDVLGAMDGTYIAADIRKSQVAAYRNWKGQVRQNVFPTCTFRMYLCYRLSGWEGSAHDVSVFKDALGKGLAIPNGKYYLGDAGYALDDKCLTPYRAVRYHLHEHYQSRKK